MITRRTLVQSLAVAPLAGAAVLRVPGAFAQDASPVRVASKDFPESIAIGEMYALLLEHAGLKVERSLNLGGTAIAQEALVSNKIDLYPEYTGTGLLVVLKKTLKDVPGLATPVAEASPAAGATPAAASAVDAVYQYVKDQYKSQFNLVWLDQDQMNDSQALAVTKDFAAKNNLTTISQLVALASTVDITISAPVDFEDRDDGLKGLKQVYGDFNAKVNGVAPGLKYQAFLDGDANVVLAFSTDAEIAINNLVVLQDDKGLWPPYYVAPVVRQEAIDANPALAGALNALAPVLTTDAMIKLNGEIVGDQKKDPKDVAKEFLTQQGLIS
jgi:osmoprotectant transport system substrate-binding protein